MPAVLISMRCPALGGALMLTAVTTRGPTLVITFEDSSGISSAERADRAAFRGFLASIQLRA